jgi:hypothetical protein
VAAYNLKRMTNPTQLGTSAVSVYTAGSGITAVVKQVLATNCTANSTTFSMHLVPTGGTTTTSNQIFCLIPVPAYSTLAIDLAQVLNAGDSLHALAGTTSSINLTVSGYEAS